MLGLELAVLSMVSLAVVIFVVAPLLRPDRTIPRHDDETREELASALSRRDSTYEALADLDADRAAGKLSEEDYTDLRESYQREAITALRDLERLSTQSGKTGPT